MLFLGVSDMLLKRTTPDTSLALKRHTEPQISVKCVNIELVLVSMAAVLMGPLPNRCQPRNRLRKQRRQRAEQRLNYFRSTPDHATDALEREVKRH